MIATASQTLARLLAQGLAQVFQEQPLFEHPQRCRRDEPGLNLSCYHVRHTERVRHSDCRWFDLTFLVGIVHSTRLGEQSLFSNVLALLPHDQRLPDVILDRTLRGYGALQTRMFTQTSAENVVFWTFLLCSLVASVANDVDGAPPTLLSNSA